jgi:hypothetical protein
MTKRELATYFKKVYQNIENGFLAAEKAIPELKKNKDINGHTSSNYTLEEVLSALPYMPFKVSKIEIELLKENFIYHDTDIISDKKEFDPMIPGMKEFLEETKDYAYRPCCETCIYLSGKAYRTSRLKPFCAFYQFFMHRKNVDIFHDYCKTYKYKKRDPIIWYKENAPVNQITFQKTADTETVIDELF